MNECTVNNRLQRAVVAQLPHCQPGTRSPTWEEHGLFLREGGLFSRKLRPVNKGAAGGVGPTPPRPLMNLFPLISEWPLKGGMQRQLECLCLSSPGVLLLLPGHSSDRGLPGGPRVGLT